MIKIGITGSLASGKTTASKFLSLKRGPLFSADKAVKEMYQNKNFRSLISRKFKIKNTGMLIYNKNLSVCPMTTHLPLKLVPKNITKKLLIEKIQLIHNFYKKQFGFKPKIAVTGLNPHCESILKYNLNRDYYINLSIY